MVFYAALIRRDVRDDFSSGHPSLQIERLACRSNPQLNLNRFANVETLGRLCGQRELHKDLAAALHGRYVSDALGNVKSWRQRLSDIAATRAKSRSYEHRGEDQNRGCMALKHHSRAHPACWRHHSQQIVRLARASGTEADQCVITS